VLLAQARVDGAACLLVTHAQAAAARADRVLRLTMRGVEAHRMPASDSTPR
jgi:putative ABC transport system ATP-binding protein